jgi:hypothetical protein
VWIAAHEAPALVGSVDVLDAAFKNGMPARGAWFQVSSNMDPDLIPPDLIPPDKHIPPKWRVDPTRDELRRLLEVQRQFDPAASKPALNEGDIDAAFTALKVSVDYILDRAVLSLIEKAYSGPTGHVITVRVFGLELERATVLRLAKSGTKSTRAPGRPKGSLSPVWQKIFKHFDPIIRDDQYPNLNSVADDVEVWVRENIKRKSSRPHRRTIERVIFQHRRRWIDPDWQPAKIN